MMLDDTLPAAATRDNPGCSTVNDVGTGTNHEEPKSCRLSVLISRGTARSRLTEIFQPSYHQTCQRGTGSSETLSQSHTSTARKQNQRKRSRGSVRTKKYFTTLRIPKRKQQKRKKKKKFQHDVRRGNNDMHPMVM